MRRKFAVGVESLEGRSLMSTVNLTVNTLADDPSGPIAGKTTLRDAITAGQMPDRSPISMSSSSRSMERSRWLHHCLP